MREIMTSHECYRRQITQLNSEICVRISYFLGRNIKPALVQASLRYLSTGFQDYSDLQELPDSPDTQSHISRVLAGSTLWDHESRKRKRIVKNRTNRWERSDCVLSLYELQPQNPPPSPLAWKMQVLAADQRESAVLNHCHANRIEAHCLCF